MKKTKINSQEAQNIFAAKYGSNITVNPIKMIVESSNDKPVLEKKLFINVHGTALDNDAIITCDQVVQLTPDNGDMFEQRLLCESIDAFYSEGAIVIDGFECIVN